MGSGSTTWSGTDEVSRQLGGWAEVPSPVVVQLATTSFTRHLIDVHMLVASIFVGINHSVLCIVQMLMSDDGIVHSIWRFLSTLTFGG